MAKRAQSRATRSEPRAKGVAVHLVSMPTTPSHDIIAQRAFELFMSRGGAPGGEMMDWLTAESELQI